MTYLMQKGTALARAARIACCTLVTLTLALGLVPEGALAFEGGVIL